MRLDFSVRKAGFLLSAAVLLAAGSLISGCGGSQPAVSQAVSNQENLKPGEAAVHRGQDVTYSVPEGVSVLMYHMIGPQKNNAAIENPDNFRRQMKYLKDHGYHPITMQELYDYVTKGSALPEKPVCITFDDGYEDSYKIVYPVMKEMGFPWTVFVITDDVGRPNYLTWDQLKEMANSHTVTIANHTLSHPKLHNLGTKAEKEKEIVGANQALKYHLGIDNVWLAYPYGDYDDEVIDICKKAGIKMAVTTDAGRVHVGSEPFDLKRVYIGNDVNIDHFAERLNKDNYSPL